MSFQIELFCSELFVPTIPSTDRRAVFIQSFFLLELGQSGKFRTQGMARSQEQFLPVENWRVYSRLKVIQLDSECLQVDR